MKKKDTAIEVTNLSKRYRIGVKDELNENFISTLIDFIKSPLTNYRKYRSLYIFDEDKNNPDSQNETDSDILWAVRDVSFDVKKGEVLGIIGRNGAGKSTLLKILSRITDPTSGQAEIKGRVSSLLEVGTGFHQELSGRENVYLNGTILGMRKQEIDEKYDEIVDFSGVRKFINTPIKRYSSGMKVRLAFAVAAFLEPEILIIDEVLAVGDDEFQKKCLNKMEDVGNMGRSVLFVSHNMSAVTRLCHRVIRMENGTVVDDDTPDKVVSRYLVSDSGTTASREWTDKDKAPSSSIAQLCAVRVKTEDENVTDSIDIRKGFKVEMEYNILKSNYVLLPIFVLKNDKGDTVFVSVDQDPEWRKQARPKGTYISTVWIPGNLLAEGIHYVNSLILELSSDKVQFAERNAVSFIVVDSLDGDSARGDYSKNFKGVVRPLLKWTTQYIKSESRTTSI